MPFPTTVDAIVDAPPVTAATRITSSQVLGPQRVVVGPLLFNVLSDLYSASSTVAAKTTAAAADANFGNSGGLVAIPPTASGMVPPTAPTVTVNGAAGTTVYTYFVLALNAAGDVVASLPTTIANGNATLSVSNFNAVSWGSVTGATSYKLVRSLGGATTGVIITQTGTSFNDQGAAGAAFAYPTLGLPTLAPLATTLDQRYLPTVQPAAISRAGVSNQWQTSDFYLSKRWDVGNDNGTVLAADVWATGGSSSGAGDGEQVAVYAGATRTAGTRGIWGFNTSVITNVAPAATMVTNSAELDLTNNSGADATLSTPMDGLVITNFGANKSRFGIHINSSGPSWLVPLQIDGGAATVQGLVIQGLTSSSIRITPANDLASNNEVFGSNAANNAVVWQINNDGSAQFRRLASVGTPAPTLGALQTGIASQSISGTDMRFTVTVTAAGGGGPGAFANVALVTFGTAFTSTPFVVIAPAGNSFSGGITNVMITSVSTTGITIITQSAMPANQVQSYTCVVIG